HVSLSKLLASATEFSGSQDHIIMDRLRYTHEAVGSLFPQLVTNHQERQSDKGKGEVLEELDSRLTGQIMHKTHTMLSDTLSLSHHSRAGVLEAQHRVNVAVMAFGGIVVCIIVSTLFLTLRSVTQPLAKLCEGTASVVAGNLDCQLGVTTQDEIGELARAFDQMTEKLKTTTVSRDELVESARVLAASAEEILVSTTQRAAGSAQTATAVGETTATVEEVKRTAQVAAEKARYVSERAQKTAQISQSGRKSVL